MNHKALVTIKEYQMLQQGDRVAAGVSGGADSVALLHFLWEIAPAYGLSVTALHLNHCLRGKESDGDEAFVAELCARLRVPLVGVRRPVGELAVERGIGIEECARQERYAFFAGQAARLNGKAATAHTVNDSLETMVLNLARGTGLRGLGGIPPVRALAGGGVVIRPLIACSRQEVEAYCRRHGLGFRTDSSNNSDDYTRNRIRHHVMPVLRVVNPALEETAAGMLAGLRADEEYLGGLAKQALETISLAPGGVSRQGYLEQPAPLACRCLIALLRQRGIDYSRGRLAQMEELIRKGEGSLQLSGKWFFHVEAESFRLEEKDEEEPWFSLSVNLARENLPLTLEPVAGKTVHIVRTDYEIFEKTNKDSKKALKNALDYDRIRKLLSVRQRLPGDGYRPAGRGCTKTLRKLFNEQKLTLRQRSRTLVLAHEDQLLWVEGFGPAAQCGVQKGITRQVLVLTVAEDVYEAGH